MSAINEPASEENLSQYLRSLNDSMPVIEKGSKVSQSQLRECIRDMYQTLGLEWSDHIGTKLVFEALELFDSKHEGQITVEQLKQLLSEYKKRPRRITRHPLKVVVLGGGAFGTGVGQVLSRKGHYVTILMRPVEQEFIDSINNNHINTMCFGDHVLDNGITATSDPEKAFEGTVELIIHAVPVQFSTGYLQKIVHLIKKDRQGLPFAPIVSTAKGIDIKSLGFMKDVFESVLGEDYPCGFISGPSFASGLIKGDPTAATLACSDAELGKKIQGFISSPDFRVFSSTDVIGIEAVGALKNVLSIGSGVCKGLGYGPNTQALVVTRGWKDIFSMVKALGGKMETLLSLGGLGDLMMTCFGGESRNASFGSNLASGLDVDTALKKVGQVVEGYSTAGAARRLAQELKIDTPVINVLADLCEDKIGAEDVVAYLMALPLSKEFEMFEDS